MFAAELGRALRVAMRKLPQRQRRVIAALFGIDCRRRTLREAALHLGVSHQFIGYLRDKAMLSLSKNAVLRDIWGLNSLPPRSRAFDKIWLRTWRASAQAGKVQRAAQTSMRRRIGRPPYKRNFPCMSLGTKALAEYMDRLRAQV